MKNLLTRTLTGIVFVAVIIGSLLLSQYSFAVVFLTVMLMGLHEFSRFFDRTTIVLPKISLFMVSSAIYTISFLIASGNIGYKNIFLFIPLILVMPVVELYRITEKPLQNAAVSIFSILYIAMPFSLTSFLVFGSKQLFDPSILIALFVIIWLYDSAAYIFGVSFGKRRLFERISPKKSWEGAIGGALSAIIGSYFIAGFVTGIPAIHWIIISILTVISSTFGDLTESMFKRQFDLKDSSSILPGHGGILDRFDSLLFDVPVVLVYIKLFV